MYGSVSDTNKPGLRVWAALKKLVGRGTPVVCQSELACLDVDCHNPTLIAVFDLRFYSLLVESVSTTCEFVFGVARSPGWHFFLASFGLFVEVIVAYSLPLY
jgi:hypothetical protein